MINYSIHTLELQSCISYKAYETLLQTLKNLTLSIESNKYHYKSEHTYTIFSYTYRNLPCHGINSIKLTTVKLETYTIRNSIYIYINPFNAIHACQGSGPYTIKICHIKKAIENILNALSNILDYETIDSLTLNRLDFCADLKFDSQIQAEEYIKLLKCGIPPKVLSEHIYFNEKQHRYTTYKESLLLECKSYSFQAYSKYEQMINHKMAHPENASGIVRLELRASKTKLEQLAKKYGLVSPKENYIQFLLSSPSITRQEIPEIISKMVGSSDFHEYQYVKKQILESSMKDSDKSMMLDIINYLSRHSSAQDLLEKFYITNKDWKKIIQKFNQIECSPIPIPRTYKYTVYPGVATWSNLTLS